MQGSRHDTTLGEHAASQKGRTFRWPSPAGFNHYFFLRTPLAYELVGHLRALARQRGPLVGAAAEAQYP